MKFVAIITASLTLCATAAHSAESYIAMEAHTGKVLLAANSEKKRPVASLTKIATAKVVLDWAQASQTSLATLATVPQAAFTFASANPMGVQPGDRISLRDAIYSAMMGSDNIAAYTLADHVGRALLAHRRKTGDPQRVFVYEMNNLAKALGMRRTKFATPHGLNLQRRSGYSTASDIARLSVHAMRDTGFQFYVKQKSRTIQVIKASGRKLSYKVTNTNPLLNQLGVNGIKTGTTAAAGQCLAVNAHRKPLVKKLSDERSQIRYRDLIVVVLGSADRAGRSRQLISQAWPMYDQWAAGGYQLTNKGKELIRVPVLRK
ncbi:MAG: D-alanyl-D-alanine carboxypeptidase family protein [Akkermansiaceae bacterium]